MSDLSTLAQALANGVLRSGLYGLTSVGLALSVGVIGIVNFAHGEFLMFGAYLGAFLFLTWRLDPLLSFPLAAAALFALGVLLYRFSIKRVLRSAEINQMLFTFALSVIFQNVALILWSGDPIAINVPYRSVSLHLGIINLGLARLVGFLLAAFLILLLYLMLSRTAVGRAMRAVSQNRMAAGLVGIEVETVYASTFGLSAALAGVAGVTLGMVLYAEPTIGMHFTLKAFCIVVLAGLGNINGVLWGSLLLGVTESLVGTYIPNGTGWAESVFFILILAVLLARPRQVMES